MTQVGFLHSSDQSRICAGLGSDLEAEHDGREPDDTGIADLDGLAEQTTGWMQ